MMPISASDVCDNSDLHPRVCVAPWRSFGKRASASGRVVTLRAHEDANLLRQRLAQPGAGRVVVFDGGGSLRLAVLGDNMARLALQSGWAGILIHGAVRDVEALKQVDIAVFALGCVPMPGGRSGGGDSGVDLVFGETTIRAGDFITMDADGVVLTEAAPPSQPERAAGTAAGYLGSA